MIRQFLSVYREILRGHGLIICFSTLKLQLKTELRLASSIALVFTWPHQNSNDMDATEWIIKLLWNLAFVTSETPDYCPAMAFERSGCRAGCKAVTSFSWSRVINTIPVAIRHFEHTVTELLISNCLDISTAPWSLLEETVMPRNLLLSEVIHLTELCTDIVTTLKPSSRKSCSWLGQAFVVISMNENKAKVNIMIGDRSISRSVW